VFENGHVVEAGTFDELVQLGGRFAALAKAQFLAAEQAHRSSGRELIEEMEPG
jgi:ATP-binding cassette subfamily B protein